MLASVRNLEEATVVYECGADIIDLKEPNHGALGAIPFDVMHCIVDTLWGKCLISATTGDLPADAAAIEEQVLKTAETGVDFVKVGMFSKHHLESCLPRLSSCTGRGISIIAVMFADLHSDLDSTIDSVKNAGLKGIMLDTARKGSGSLLKHVNLQHLKQFVNRSKQKGLLTGLAGSLTIEDVPKLIKAGPHYIGFRSALCSRKERTGYIDRNTFLEVRRTIPSLAGHSHASENS